MFEKPDKPVIDLWPFPLYFNTVIFLDDLSLRKIRLCNGEQRPTTNKCPIGRVEITCV